MECVSGREASKYHSLELNTSINRLVGRKYFIFVES